jgi:thymidylate synthase
MFISQPTVDDLLRRVFAKLLKDNVQVKGSTKGANSELSGVLLELTNPRARLSRTENRGGTLFGCLGELLWYLSGSDQLSFVRYYLPEYPDDTQDGQTVPDAYGPRLFGVTGPNQIKNIIELLRNKADTRKAVIQIFDACDIDANLKAIPCTCTFQFLIRGDRLHMITTMRSNDAFIGLPHDIFSFTMFQELLARTLDVELGTYKHFVGSLHLYDINKARAQDYLREGWQSLVPMPAMPMGDPWPSIEQVSRAESEIRLTHATAVDESAIEPYWADLLRILKILSSIKRKDLREVVRLRNSMASPVYAMYIRQKENRLQAEQLELLRGYASVHT